MQPRSHRAVIRLGLERTGVLAGLEEAVGAGSDDEDVYRWPLGVRTPAIGFTHSYRPGRTRGELGFPSARDRCAKMFAEGKQLFSRERWRGAWLLGRACHLLVDAGVPARTHGVWHYLGDPLEGWIERNLAELERIGPIELPSLARPEELVERLAGRAFPHPADRTRTIEGWVASRLGWRRPLAEEVVAAQARELFPLAVAHVARILQLFADG